MKKSITTNELLASQDENVKQFMPPIIHEGALGMIHAYPGVGKTHLALWLGIAAAAGMDFLKWLGLTPARVLYIDGELTKKVLKPMITNIIKSSNYDFQQDYFKVIYPDMFTDFAIPDISKPFGADYLQREAADRDLIIIDNLGSVTSIDDRNELAVINAVNKLLIQLRSQKKAVIVVHHSGKSGKQLGSMTKERPLNWIIHLKRPADYEQSEGARFDIIFEKTRGFLGSHAEPLSVALQTDSKGKQFWHWESRAASIESIVFKMKFGGKMTEVQIQKETGIPLYTIKRLLQTFKQDEQPLGKLTVEKGCKEEDVTNTF